jgi:hypothetical protein
MSGHRLPRLESIQAEVRLAFHEWQSLIGGSLSYELRKRVVDSQILGPAHASLMIVEENVKQIASRGFAARMKLTRIMMRLASALLNNNREALQNALSDLLELGKKVSK